MVTEWGRGNKEYGQGLRGSRGPGVRQQWQRLETLPRGSPGEQGLSQFQESGRTTSNRLNAKKLDPTALKTAPGALINKRAVYFIVFLFFRKNPCDLSFLPLEAPGRWWAPAGLVGAGRASSRAPGLSPCRPRCSPPAGTAGVGRRWPQKRRRRRPLSPSASKRRPSSPALRGSSCGRCGF